jgi:acetyl-CoA acetyltransferase
MREHGLPREAYGELVVAQRRWAALNPHAVYREPLSLDEYLSAPVVADPLCLLDCVPVVAGADAVVVTTRDRARKPAASVAAFAAVVNVDDQEGSGLRTGLGEVAPALWEQAGLAPRDVDVVSVYDDYPVMVFVQLADLGFGSPPDVLDAVRAERLALNTSGGQLAAGQAGAAGGLHGVVEAVRQLRGLAGERQVADCDSALVTGYGIVGYRYGICASAAVLRRVS